MTITLNLEPFVDLFLNYVGFMMLAAPIILGFAAWDTAREWCRRYRLTPVERAREDEHRRKCREIIASYDVRG